MNAEVNIAVDFAEAHVPKSALPPGPAHAQPAALAVEVLLCIPQDQAHHVPRRRRAPERIPSDAPLPRTGDVIYLSRSSAWGVQMVIHDWLSPADLRVEVWLDHVDSAHLHRPAGFALTQ